MDIMLNRLIGDTFYMAKPTVGSRVAAVVSANQTQINFLGYGRYAGDFIPPADAVGFGSMLHQMCVPNPKIILDSGEEVFGCECWWSSAEAFDANIKGRELVHVTVKQLRESKQEQAQ